MKIFGVFRGFPGLGRVVAGASILSELRRRGHEVKAYSYLQGLPVLKNEGLDLIISEQPTTNQISAIGLSPICETAADLIRVICEQKPDLVILDGEPLLVSTLSLVYPRERLLALLNPTDLHNPSLPDSTLLFYHTHYLSAGKAIVHGLDKNSVVLPKELHGCDVLCTNTILRRQIFELNSREDDKKTEITVILGGGTRNASENFWNSTVEMGKHIVLASNMLPDESFTVYCNDDKIADALLKENSSKNIRIVADYASPEAIYTPAKMIICRAGRNTISEVLYLGLPTLLMPSSGDFRSAEQEANIDMVCRMCSRIRRFVSDDSVELLVKRIMNTMNSSDPGYNFVPGNQDAIEFIISTL